MFQRSKANWLKEGDDIIYLFNAYIKSRSMRNVILILKVGKSWIKGMPEIKQDFFLNYFTNIFIDSINPDLVEFLLTLI